jgi:hypothetical protein
MSQREVEMRTRESRFETDARRERDAAPPLRGRRIDRSRGVEKP